MKLVTATGKEINVLRVMTGGMMGYLALYINTLTPAEIYSIFYKNPTETEILKAYEEKKDGTVVEHIYKDYTELYAVREPLLTSPEGTLMAMLRRPAEVVIDAE